MRRVVWAIEAIDALEEIGDYIAREADPRTAARFVAKLRQGGDALAILPERGRSVGRGLRELAIVRPYLIRYRVFDDEVVITRVRHGARRPLR